MASDLYAGVAVPVTGDRAIHLRSRTIHSRTTTVRPEAFSGRSKARFLVQFARPIEIQEREAWAERGIILHDAVEYNAFYVTLPQLEAADFAAEGVVLGIHEIEVSDKVHAALLEGRIPPFAWTADGRLDVEVVFYSDVAKGEALELLSDYDAEPQEQSEDRFAGIKAIRANLELKHLNALAAEDAVYWIEHHFGDPVTKNQSAGGLARVSNLQGNPYNLSGADINLAIYDGGNMDWNHTQVLGRVVPHNRAVRIDSHATHVGGTMIANGQGNFSARGMAHEATAKSYFFNPNFWYTWTRDAYLNFQALAANNSWGEPSGWEQGSTGGWIWTGTDGFGAYNLDARERDQAVDDTNISVVFAAGNDRGEFNGRAGIPFPPDWEYHTVGPSASAKNTITVGAHDNNYGETSFSSWGPTDDGRIKPDIMAKGINFSLQPNNGFGTSVGTSMAAPVVSGAIALIQEAYIARFGRKANSTLIRGLVLNNARITGRLGPNYERGFGNLDAKLAVDMINNAADARDAGEPYRHFIEGVMTQAAGEEHVYYIPNTNTDLQLRIMLIWEDPPGALTNKVALQNDLDLEVYRPNGVITYPYVMDPMRPELHSQRGVNSIDNVEQVIFAPPVEGEYMIRVKGTALARAPQRYWLVATAGMQDTPTGMPTVAPETPTPTPSPTPTPTVNPFRTYLEWTGGSPDPDANLIYTVYLGRDDMAPQQIVQDQEKPTRVELGRLAPDTTYYWQVFARDLDGRAWRISPLWSFRTAESRFDTPTPTPTGNVPTPTPTPTASAGGVPSVRMAGYGNTDLTAPGGDLQVLAWLQDGDMATNQVSIGYAGTDLGIPLTRLDGEIFGFNAPLGPVAPGTLPLELIPMDGQGIPGPVWPYLNVEPGPQGPPIGTRAGQPNQPSNPFPPHGTVNVNPN